MLLLTKINRRITVSIKSCLLWDCIVDNKTFSREQLNSIFRTSPKNPDKMLSRESSSLEFKLSFGWRSLPGYLKTFAAFANAKGGYLVFGVANRPRKLVGLTDTSKHLFEDIDPERMTNNLNKFFAPEIAWDIQEYELDGKTYGLIYVYESQDKPIICINNLENGLIEGSIYYRYRGLSTRIKYPELKDILESKRGNEQRLWMQHLLKIARIGVRDTGIFDLQTGQVTGSTGSFLIDESLLSQLSFIKEGEFSEVKGKPTLKVIGKAEVISGVPLQTRGKSIIKTKGIRISDIVLAFLRQDEVQEPRDYITQICFENTAFLPLYFFIQLGKLDRDETIQLINGVVCRSTSRHKLIERLERGFTQNLVIPSGNTSTAKKKRYFVRQLVQQQMNIDISGKDLEYCLQSIRSLTSKEIQQHNEYLCNLLKTWFNKYYASSEGTLADNLRRAICWIDEALYKAI